MTEPSIGERIERSASVQIAIGILIVAALLAQVAIHLPDSSAVKGEVGSGADYVLRIAALESQWEVFAPNPRSTSLKLEGRVTFEDGSTKVWHLPEGARIGENLRSYRWRKWLERVRSDDFRNLWQPTCEWIASLYRRRRLAGREGPARAAVPRQPTDRRAAALRRVHVPHLPTRASPMTAPTAVKTSPWVTFFFRPQSTSPMTLVRIGWGATATVWAISLLPDIDPFFVKDDLLYDRTLSPGAWNRCRTSPEPMPG